MSRYPHLDEKTARAADLPDEDRIAYLDIPLWISYPRAEELLRLMRETMKTPKRPRMPNLMIVGESNMGKTSILARFMDGNPGVMYEDEFGSKRTRVPAVMILAPAIADERNLYTAVLEKFWTSFRPTDPVAKLRHQMLHLLRTHETEALVIDEIHNLLETTPVRQRQVMNAIKNLGNELQIPIIAAGTDVAATILGADPQFASRFDLVRLSRWKLDREFLGLLKAFERRLPLRNPSALYGKEKAPLLLEISEGNLGNLHRLLAECAKSAIRDGVEEIDVARIRKHKWMRPTRRGRAREIPL